MAKIRTGAATWEQLIVKACRLSHTAGWRSAIGTAFGDSATDILQAWDVFCALIETFIGGDDYPFKIDATVGYGPEDLPPP